MASRRDKMQDEPNYMPTDRPREEPPKCCSRKWQETTHLFKLTNWNTIVNFYPSLSNVYGYRIRNITRYNPFGQTGSQGPVIIRSAKLSYFHEPLNTINGQPSGFIYCTPLPDDFTAPIPHARGPYTTSGSMTEISKIDFQLYDLNEQAYNLGNNPAAPVTILLEIGFFSTTKI